MGINLDEIFGSLHELDLCLLMPSACMVIFFHFTCTELIQQCLCIVITAKMLMIREDDFFSQILGRAAYHFIKGWKKDTKMEHL